jgi:tetratricopeptide (TPR) repeat protein
VATNLHDLAIDVKAQGRSDEALELDRRAVTIAEKAFGPDHPTFAEHLVGLGLSLARLGRFAEADEPLRRAEAIFTKLHGADHITVLRVRVVRGDILTAQSRWRESARLYERLLPLLVKAQGVGDSLTALRLNLAWAYLELHQPSRAVPLVEPLVDDKGETPGARGVARFTLARALWDGGGSRQRALALGEGARAELAATGGGFVDELGQLDRWLATHRTR